MHPLPPDSDTAAPTGLSTFSAEARSARAARHDIRRRLAAVDQRTVEEVELLVGELFADAVAGASGTDRVNLRIWQSVRRIRIEVVRESTNDAAGGTQARDPLECSILERLLDAFAQRWGRNSNPAEGASTGTTSTWFELAPR